jgi:hypothetical protein
MRKPEARRALVNLLFSLRSGGGVSGLFSNLGKYPSLSGRERNCLFVNGRGTRFVEAGYPLGIDVDLEGRGVAVADVDQDGALDLVVRNHSRQKLIYFHNELRKAGHFLRVELVGTRSNRDAIGAVAQLTAGGMRQIRVKTAGSGFQSQSEGVLHFGVGEATRIEKLVIRWPSGLSQTFQDLPADHVVRLVEGDAAAAPRRLPGWRPAPSLAAPPSAAPEEPARP